MDRRSFFQSAASAGLATGITTLLSSEAPAAATGDANQEYRELFNEVERNEQYVGDWRDDNRVPDGDNIHRMRVLAIIHARRWAIDCGIEFSWGQHAEPRDVDYPWYCRARLKGVWLDCEPEWAFGGGDPTTERALALLAEGQIALRMMASFVRGGGDYDANAEFFDTESGQIVYSQDRPRQKDCPENPMAAETIDAVIAELERQERSRIKWAAKHGISIRV